jgi:hypothetical protein
LSMAWLRRPGPRWLAGAATLALVLLIAWSVLLRPEPLREYVPWCGGSRDPVRIEGEVRERFSLLMGEVFDSFGVERVTRDGRIFLRGEGILEGRPWPVVNIEMNFQHRVVGTIAEGVTIDEVFFPPPPALVQAIRESEQFYGPFPRRDEKGQRILGADPRFENCALMRAAILKKP